MRITRYLLIAAILAAAAKPAVATDGHFLHGVGAINSAMGGAGVAAPRSLLGAFYLNPAGLSAFRGTRMEFGFELFLPDRTVASSAGGASNSTTSTSEFTPVPAMGLSMQVNDKVTVGLGALGVGGFGVDYAASSPAATPPNPILMPEPNGFGAVYSNYSLLKITPAIAYQVSERLSLGAALNVDWAALAVRPAPFASPDGAYYPSAPNADGAFGFGFQLGAILKVNEMVSVGASYSSPQWFNAFEWNSSVANPLVNYGAPRTVTFRMDVPAVYAAGVALHPSPRLLVAADGRYITYEQTEGFKGSGYAADGSVRGFGWKNIFVGALGLDFQASDRLALRAGYNYSGNPVPNALSMFNVPAPAIVQHHVTLGAGIRVSPALEMSLGYYHAFKNSGSGPIVLPTGAIPGSSVTNSLAENSFSMQFSVTPQRH